MHVSKLFNPKIPSEAGRLICVIAIQFSKAVSLTFSNEFGNSKFIRVEQSANEWSSINFNEDGLSIVTVFKFKQFSKEFLQISVTDEGINNSTISVQLLNAYGPILVTHDGITTFLNSVLQKVLSSIDVKYGGNEEISSRHEQLLKALDSIDVTDDGIDISNWFTIFKCTTFNCF